MEQHVGGNKCQGYLKFLLTEDEAIIMFIRGVIKSTEENHNDTGTADFLTGLTMEHEEMRWKISAGIQ